MHDWGCVGLLWAQRFPERVERLVVIDAVPLLPGYRWHQVARVWRTRGAGELAMGATSRATLRQATREAAGTSGVMPDDWLDDTIAHLDQGTQRAILRLYRSSPPAKLADAGARLGEHHVPGATSSGATAIRTSRRASRAPTREALGGDAEPRC